MKLLYRSSRDGLELDTLKDKIMNKSNLIFLFLTGNTRIFGAYIKAKIIVGHNIYTKDKDAFIFSLNNNRIYNILIPDLALKFLNHNPVLIGNNANSNGFWIYSGKIDDKGLLNNPKVYNFQKINELTENENMSNEFEILEIN